MLCTVQGGTGAGRSMHRRHVAKTSWSCANGHTNKFYAVTCLHDNCREKRKGG